MGNRVYSAGVTAPAAFAALSAPDFTIPWKPSSIALINEDATAANYVEISFDGTNVHGRLTPTINAGLTYELPYRKIWLRRGAGTPVVRLVAVE